MLQAVSWSKRIIARLLVFVVFVANLWSFSPAPASAIASSDLTRIKQELIEQAKKHSVNAVEEVLKMKDLTVEESAKLSRFAIEQSYRLPGSTQTAVNYMFKLLADKRLIANAQKFSNITTGNFCRAYSESVQGVDGATWAAVEKGAETTFAVAEAMMSASAAGAGSLSGYAGIASVVSHLGLGSITTSIAGFLGSNAAGAAATSVVTASVGGPVVMGALLASGVMVTAYGTYELGKFSADKFNDWAGSYCMLSASLN